jgi:hypothetical protein
MPQPKTHVTSSEVTIMQYPGGGVIIQPKHGFGDIALSETEFRELIMYGVAYFETKSKDGR